MAAINADPEVMRWIGDGSPIDEEATAAGTARSEQHWDIHGFGLFAVEIRATGELAGFTGLNTPTRCPRSCPPSKSAGAWAGGIGVRASPSKRPERPSTSASPTGDST